MTIDLQDLSDKKIYRINFNFSSNDDDFYLPASLEIEFDYFENSEILYLLSPASICFLGVKRYSINLKAGTVDIPNIIDNDALFISRVCQSDFNDINKYVISFIDNVGDIEIYAESFLIKKLIDQPIFIAGSAYIPRELRKGVLVRNSSKK